MFYKIKMVVKAVIIPLTIKKPCRIVSGTKYAFLETLGFKNKYSTWVEIYIYFTKGGRLRSK